MDADFWAKWYKADGLERKKLVETLTLPSRKLTGRLYKHQCAVLMNSYLVDLAEYLEDLFKEE